MTDGNSGNDRGIEALFDRRDYLQGVAGAGAIAALGIPSLSGSAAADLRSQDSRRDEAYNNRRNAANALIHGLTEYEDQPNDPILEGEDGDEYYYGVYMKSIASSPVEGVDKQNYDDFVEALENEGSFDDFDSGERKLVAPHAARHFPTDGMDSWMGTMPTPPSFDSDMFSAELAEVYWMEQFRDVTLGHFDDETALFGAYEEDAKMIRGDPYNLDPEWIDIENPFRGVSEGAHTGPYLTQFLLQEAELGNVPIDPRVRPFSEGSDQYRTNDVGQRNDMIVGEGTSAKNYNHSGAEPGDGKVFPDRELAEERWITTGRDLASYVRVDPAYVPYVIPTLQLFDWGADFDSGLPYIDDDTALSYINYGGVGLLDLLARVTRNALNAAWYQKWLVHRRVRPLTASTTISRGDPDDVMSDLVFESNVYDETEVETAYYNNTVHYLSVAYTEGAPAHPAYPSGHSTIAGACSTVLKTFFEDSNLLDLPHFETLYVPDGDGGRQELDESDTETLTVHGEIEKLAENLGMGRIWAGVHYPTDHIYGVKLGEQVAIATLLNELVDDLEQSYAPIENLTYTPFDPDAIDDSTLNADGTAPITIDVLEQLREDAHNTEL